jgi:hypothetical protein
MRPSIKLNSLALAVALVMPFTANAESNFQSTAGAGALNATAHVDFTIVIPKILFLRVGTGAPLTTNPAVDLITFNVPAASVGNAVAIAGTGGDLLNGVVTAVVQGNNGTITLNATATGALTNATADTINYSEIVTTAAILTTATFLAAPTLTNGVSGNVTINPAPSKIVNRDARWTYTYANSAIVPPGTYGGINVNNGRVTYTASMP